MNKEINNQLEFLGEGNHNCKKGWILTPNNLGYIDIEKDDDEWSVMWLSGRKTHRLLSGGAYSVTFRKGEVVGLMLIHKMFWHTCPEEDRDELTKRVKEDIELAYEAKRFQKKGDHE